MLVPAPAGAGAAAALAYDARLCSAELIVMQGDLRQLDDPATPVHQQRGLRQRIAGALGTLNWLCRRHAALHGLADAVVLAAVERLRKAFLADDRAAMAADLQLLAARMPLDLDGLRPDSATPQARRSGEQIYRAYCAGCHESVDADAELPANSLFDMARGLSVEEFAARMLLGVRGTTEIGLRNPLSDRDIAGMFAFLLGPER